MRIVDRQTFLRLPHGTVYSEYEPCIFTGLFVKDGDTNPEAEDYFEQQLIGNVDCNDSGEFADVLESAEMSETAFSLDFEVSRRNGLFDQDQLYAIYEREDLTSFIGVLQKALDTQYK